MASGAVLWATALWVGGAMLSLWALSLARRDASIVDVFWGPGFVGIAWISRLVAGTTTPRSGLVALLATLWGLRLAAHLAWRSRGRGEDFRYRRMRERHGAGFAAWSLVGIFGLQGVLMWIVSLPLQLATSSPTPPGVGWADLPGLGVFTLGLAFETLGDWQLARFRADPANRGRVLDRGLWAWTRHPNYFGDCCVWWGFGLLALSAPGGVATLVAPALMTFLLLRVSGVPLLERSLLRSRPGYADYLRRTSAFFPRPPRRG